MDGIERLSKMVEGQKDKYLKIIVEHLITKTELNQAFLNEEKNLKDMAKFIKDNARKQANNGVAVIEDAVVFKWAEDYFVKSNEELNFNKTDNKKLKKIRRWMMNLVLFSVQVAITKKKLLNKYLFLDKYKKMLIMEDTNGIFKSKI